MKSHRFGCDHVHQGSSLGAGEDDLVHGLGVLRLAHDDAATRSPQGLMGGGGDEVRIRDRAWVKPCGDQPCNVRDVYQKIGPHRLGNLLEPGEVQDSRVGAGSDHDHPRTAFLSDALNRIVVDHFCLSVHAVKEGAKEGTGKIHAAAVSEMSSLRQIHAKDHVTGFQDRQVRRHIGL